MRSKTMFSIKLHKQDEWYEVYSINSCSKKLVAEIPAEKLVPNFLCHSAMWGHLFSTYAKFSEKLTFLTP